jgi:hypothetical protein
MRILDSSGDTVIEWSLDDPTSVDLASATFDQLTAEAKIPFAVPPGARAGEAEQIRRFDPALDADIVWVRPVQGG